MGELQQERQTLILSILVGCFPEKFSAVPSLLLGNCNMSLKMSPLGRASESPLGARMMMMTLPEKTVGRSGRPVGRITPPASQTAYRGAT